MSKIQEKLSSSLNRMHEAHFWLHSMEVHYHNADQFRWCFNTFLKAIKEIPQLISMELQSDKKAVEWFKEKRAVLNNDPLIQVLSKKRDFVVHQAMLLPESSGTIGLTDGSKLRFGLGHEIHPLVDSDEAMHDYLVITKDIFGILQDDEDTIPCVERSWKIAEFEDELANLCAAAWLKISETIREALEVLGETLPPLDLSCRHMSANYRLKHYSRKALQELLSSHQ